MEKQQKEFLLRQQLAAVRKELDRPERRRRRTEEDDYRARVEAADLPEKVREAALQRGRQARAHHRPVARRPAGSAPGSTPSSTSRGTSGPRTPTTSPAPRAILDEDHTGLDDVKDRIIEYLAVRKRRSDRGPRRRRRPRAPAPCSPWSARPASARRRSASRWRGPWAASSSGSRSAACGTRRRSAATGAPTSARCPAGSSGPSARRAR